MIKDNKLDPLNLQSKEKSKSHSLEITLQEMNQKYIFRTYLVLLDSGIWKVIKPYIPQSSIHVVDERSELGGCLNVLVERLCEISVKIANFYFPCQNFVHEDQRFMHILVALQMVKEPLYSIFVFVNKSILWFLNQCVWFNVFDP